MESRTVIEKMNEVMYEEGCFKELELQTSCVCRSGAVAALGKSLAGRAKGFVEYELLCSILVIIESTAKIKVFYWVLLVWKMSSLYKGYE